MEQGKQSIEGQSHSKFVGKNYPRSANPIHNVFVHNILGCLEVILNITLIPTKKSKS